MRYNTFEGTTGAYIVQVCLGDLEWGRVGMWVGWVGMWLGWVGKGLDGWGWVGMDGDRSGWVS